MGNTIDDRLNFNEHISNICKSTPCQLNALIRLKTFLGSNERKVLVNSFFLSNFNYCPVILFVSSSTSLRKIENLHKRALTFLINNYVSSYEQLLQNSSKASINLRNLSASKFLKQWLIQISPMWRHFWALCFK